MPVSEGPPTLPPSLNEKTKLLATYLNTIAAGLAVTGFIGPMASYLYGTSAQTTRPLWQLCLESAVLLSLSVIMHFFARKVLGRLDR